MQEVAGERGGYLHGRGALDSDDLLYLKEQMEAEEDAELLLRRTEKRAFAAFKQDILRNVVGIKPKRPKVSSPSNEVDNEQPNQLVSAGASPDVKAESKLFSGSTHIETSSTANAQDKTHGNLKQKQEKVTQKKDTTDDGTIKRPGNVAKILLGLSYESSDEDD